MRRYWSIVEQIGFCILLVSLPIVLLATVAALELVDSQRENRHKAMMIGAHTLRSAVESEITRYLTLGSFLAKSPEIQRGDVDGFYEVAQRALPSVKGVWIVLADADGTMILNTAAPSPRLSRTRHPVPMQGQAIALRTNQPYVTDVFPGQIIGVPTATVEFPIYKDGRPYMSLALVLNLQAFNQIVAGARGEDDWIVAITDRDGRFVARSLGADMVGKDSNPDWLRQAQATPSGEGMIRTASVEGDDYISYFATTAQGWRVAIGNSVASIEAPLRRAQTVVLTVSGVVVVTCFLVAFLLARRISRGVLGIGRAAEQLVNREPFTFPVHWTKEIKQAEDGFRHAATLAAKQKQYEKRIEVIAAELAHRSKNTLAVVDAMVRKIASKCNSVPEFVEAFTPRLRAMSKTTDMLVKDDWVGAPLHKVLESVLGTFLDRVVIAGPEVSLTPQAVHSMSIAVHELATNAMKYGALSTPSGHVAITWKIEAGVCHFFWREFGGNAPQGSVKGFGSEVLSRTFKNPVHLLEPENISWSADLIQDQDFYDVRFTARQNRCPLCPA